MSENNNIVANDTTTVKQESNGTISFSNEVISTIVGLAAAEIDGVASMSGGIVDGITEFMGKKNISKGIKVEVGKEEVAVDIAIIVKYGCKITDVCKNIQQAIINAVETMTGLKVVEINISVVGIDVKDDKKAIVAANTEETPAEDASAPRVK